MICLYHIDSHSGVMQQVRVIIRTSVYCLLPAVKIHFYVLFKEEPNKKRFDTHFWAKKACSTLIKIMLVWQVVEMFNANTRTHTDTHKQVQSAGKTYLLSAQWHSWCDCGSFALPCWQRRPLWDLFLFSVMTSYCYSIFFTFTDTGHQTCSKERGRDKHQWGGIGIFFFSGIFSLSTCSWIFGKIHLKLPGWGWLNASCSACSCIIECIFCVQ